MRKPISRIKPRKRPRPAPRGKVELILDLRFIRKSKGLTLRDCEEPSGIDHATLSRIEQGRDPDLATALRYAQFVELPIERIWRAKQF